MTRGRSVVAGVALAAVVAGVTLALGAPMPRAVLLGAVTGGLLVTLARVRSDAVAWPAPVVPGRAAGWYPASLLEAAISQSARDPTSFDFRMRPRLRRLVERRLQRLGVPWDDEKARELLGADVHVLLSDGFTSAGPRAVRQVLDRVDALDRLIAAAGPGTVPATDDPTTPIMEAH